MLPARFRGQDESRLFKTLVAAVATLFLAGCPERVPLPPHLTLEQTSFSALPGWSEDRQGDALRAFLLSCPALSQSGAAAVSDTAFGARGDWQTVCDDAKSVDAGDDNAARNFFERRFTPYLAANNGESDGLFTGYYVPELKGSRKQDARFRVPIYRVPDDLITADLGQFRDDLKGVHIAGRVDKGKLRPYETRAEIDAGALSGRGLEILYVDDAIDAFFLHIQGSGRIVFDDGHAEMIGYAANNGRPYVAIGHELVESGAMTKDDVTMQSIRAWLTGHPGEAEKIMEKNPSYVFFHELKGDGAVGAEGIVLTPGRSLAVDHKFIAYGVPLWLDSRDPLKSDEPFRRLMVAQDTGGAITGPVRGDVFFGFGTEAAQQAGQMKAQGRYFILLPRNVPVAAGP